MFEMFQYAFMQRALAAGVLVGLLASYYGVFVVQRGLSFLGNGLAHAAFGGVALGLLLDAEPLWVAVPFTIAVALGIVWLKEHTRLGGDTAIGILFSVSMALGVVFLSLKKDYAAEAFGYLFGSILAVTPTDLWATGGVLAFAAATLPWWRRWAYATFDHEMAQADRLPVARDDYLLSASLAVTVVVAAKVVGVVLVASFLVIPAATARLLARRFITMTFLSLGLGTGSAVVGLVASCVLDIPSGPAIILVQAAAFAVAAVWARKK